MTKRRKVYLLSSILSLAILCGCKEESKTIQIDGETYVQTGEEYIKVNSEPKVFEPGTHIIYYVTLEDHCEYLTEGYGNSYIEVPKVPDGYRVLTVSAGQSNKHDHTSGMIYFYINEETVEAQGEYNVKTGEVEYLTPGVVIEDELTLGR